MTTSLIDANFSVLRGEAHPAFLRDENLAEIFRASAGRLPQKVALKLLGTSETLTYRELDERSDRVAAILAARGIGPGDFVGLWFRRSLDLHVGLIGIVKSGAAFIPFDADVPPDRVATSLADCGARALLTHDAIGTKANDLGVETLRLEKGYRVWGADVDPGHSPDEAGLGFCVRLDKPTDFLGREAIARRRLDGVD